MICKCSVTFQLFKKKLAKIIHDILKNEGLSKKNWEEEKHEKNAIPL